MSEQIKKFYSNKAMAMIMGSGYARQEEQTVYLHQANIDPDEYEYSLRFREDIINPESSNILRTWEYTPTVKNNVVVKAPPKQLERTATAHESNVPAGASSNPSAPFNEPDMVGCPTCHGEDKDEYCFTCEGSGELTELELRAHKDELKFDAQANE